MWFKVKRVITALVSAIGIGFFPGAFAPIIALIRIFSCSAEISINNYYCLTLNWAFKLLFYGLITAVSYLVTFIAAIFLIPEYLEKERLSKWNIVTAISGSSIIFIILLSLFMKNTPCSVNLW
jgi:hypothetical protein